MLRRYLLLLALTSPLACQSQDATAAPKTPSANARPNYRWAKIFVQSPRGEIALKVEIAEDNTQRSHGLMFKERLPDGEGMLFVFPETSEHFFWMKNTPLPLDMIFLGEDRKVVGVYENATPLSTARMGVGKPSRYVLEVPAGWARANGVGPGTQVRFEGVE
ncbi:MAG: DUF192 domain-containing protein [Myxococcota bacterium]